MSILTKLHIVINEQQIKKLFHFKPIILLKTIYEKNNKITHTYIT